MQINAKTRVFAVLGSPIGHSRSPAMHNAAFAATGLDAVYVAFSVPPNALPQVLPAMAEMGFAGVNLTVPLKEEALAVVADLDASARHIRAVNTIQFLDGGMRGYNTDGDGLLRAIEESFGAGLVGRSVFLVGAGGAGRAAAIACAMAGAARVDIANRTYSRAAALAESVAELAPEVGVAAVQGGVDAWATVAREADLVLQSTSLGLAVEDPSPLPAAAFRHGQLVMDLVYAPKETAFLRTAREAGARTADGLGLLLHQGALAFSIWTGYDAPVDVMRAALHGDGVSA